MFILVFGGNSLVFASCIDGKSLGLREPCRLKPPSDDWLRSPKRSDALRINVSESVPLGRGLSVAPFLWIDETDEYNVVGLNGTGSLKKTR